MEEDVGFDVSKEETGFCVMDKAGAILVRGKAFSDPKSLFEVLRGCPGSRHAVKINTVAGIVNLADGF